MKITGLIDYIIWIVKTRGIHKEDDWGEWESWRYGFFYYSTHIAAGRILKLFNNTVWSDI